MKLGILRETLHGENRVAITPDVAKKLKKRNINIILQKSAGNLAGYSDLDYQNNGVEIVETQSDVIKNSDIICSINNINFYTNKKISASNLKNKAYIAFLNPLVDLDNVKALSNSGLTSFSMELIPRTSRAQSMDALSSQANLAGYKSVILAVNTIKKVIPMLMTAAGTIPPAKILILGAGVAGLQAIATAKRMGAVVHAYDIRSEVKEQIESLGARFVKIKLSESGEGEGGYAKALTEESAQLQREKLGDFASDMDIIISTAQIPGRKAPLLLNKSCITKMRKGSILVDLAASSGGNIESSQVDKIVNENGVLLLGPSNLPSELAYNASSLYAQNISSFLEILIKDDKLNIDFNDDIIEGSCITYENSIKNSRVNSLINK